jgi:hypothetical protein
LFKNPRKEKVLEPESALGLEVRKDRSEDWLQTDMRELLELMKIC